MCWHILSLFPSGKPRCGRKQRNEGGIWQGEAVGRQVPGAGALLCVWVAEGQSHLLDAPTSR